MPNSKQTTAKEATKSTTKTAPAKEPAAKKPAKESSGKGLKAPLTPSPELAAVIGSDPLPRTEITKKIWDYIKEHKLQDSQNKRLINADDKLKKVFNGKSQISMFELAKEMNQHVK
jgi:chromatin remodeling complex protein RSC6